VVVDHCVFYGCKITVVYWTGQAKGCAGGVPAVNFKALPPSALELPPSSKVIDKPVEIEFDQAKRGYLHVVAGTPGAEIPAGLFTRRT
jgi:hypothetical protein